MEGGPADETLQEGLRGRRKPKREWCHGNQKRSVFAGEWTDGLKVWVWCHGVIGDVGQQFH